MMSDQEFLKSRLAYDQETGVFTRIKGVPGNKGSVGNIAGNVGNEGYVVINFQGKKKKAHRLAWLYMTGYWPEKDIDHLNGNRSDNRWINLRAADDSINAQNQRGASSNNKSGYLGVSQVGNRFKAMIRSEGKILYLGLYKTAAEAHEAYIETKRLIHPGNTL